MHSFDIEIDRVTKVEGAASVLVRVRDGKVESAQFKIEEFKRFYTQAMEGKPVTTLPQLLSRICGTCSNAHIICSIEAAERALDIEATEQTRTLRRLTMQGLNIRDHALHLYMFVAPDLVGKDAFLDFDENNPAEHQMLHDAFEIKAAGNALSHLVAGRSVHAPYPVVGGFTHFPDPKEAKKVVEMLKNARPAVLRTIEIFKNNPQSFDRKTNYMALVPEGDAYGFIEGRIKTDDGVYIEEEDFGNHLERTVLPYSQASAYKYKSEPYMVGSLARINLAKELLYHKTKETLKDTLDLFPSTDIHANGLAQAIEILNCLDHAADTLEARTFKEEEVIKKAPREAVGVGVIEAPRGTLYHKYEIAGDGTVIKGEIVVPSGQNQVNIEADLATLVSDLLPKMPKKDIPMEMEKLIRAYDPCMSCAAHFLKVNWDES